ncbi:catechol 2,3-dioxygenase-like lactoylglutathione lyase family enzyme [Bradyrhizobium liaoningense]
MITGLDHIVVLVSDIGAAKAAYQTLLARAPAWQNSGEGADRVLFTLDNMTIELMAPSGFSVTADRMRALLEDQEGMLASLCFRVADIGKMHRRLERVALRPDPVAEVESSDAVSDAVLHWKRTRAATELTRGVRMFFLELADERPKSVATDIAPIDALDHVVITTEDFRARRSTLWCAARARSRTRPLAPGLGPADVFPLRRPHRRGGAPARRRR